MRFGLTLILVAALAIGTTSIAAEPAAPYIVAHRGLIRHAPENTLAGFRACLELRIGFEVDVQRSKDGHLVCIHDDTVDRTTNGTGKVANLTLAELQALDAGSWFHPAFSDQRIPTLDELFTTLSKYPYRVLIAMDLKAAGVEEDSVKLANRHGVLDKLLFIGRTISVAEVRRNLSNTAKQARIAVVANTQEELAAALTDRDANWVYVRYVPSKTDVDQTHGAGRQVFIAGPTVAGEELENWAQATASGVDGILTDFPLSLAKTIRNVER